MNDFRHKILKLNESRIHKISNSYGIKDIYKDMKYNYDIKISEKDFRVFIKTINKLISDYISNGEEVVFPYSLGRINIIKKDPMLEYKDNTLRTNLAVDWNTTLKLWEEDEECRKNKIKVRYNVKEVYKIYYSKSQVNFKNRYVCRFQINRNIKINLKNKIKDGNLDAYIGYGKRI